MKRAHRFSVVRMCDKRHTLGLADDRRELRRNFQFFTALLGILLHHSVTIGGLMSGRQEQSYLVLEFLP